MSLGYSCRYICILYAFHCLFQAKDKEKKEKKEKKKDAEEAPAEAPAEAAPAAEEEAPKKTEEPRKKVGNVFALFNQSQIQEFKEVGRSVDEGYIDPMTGTTLQFKSNVLISSPSLAALPWPQN